MKTRKPIRYRNRAKSCKMCIVHIKANIRFIETRIVKIRRLKRSKHTKAHLDAVADLAASEALFRSKTAIQ